MRFRPGYIELYETGELARRISTLSLILKDCTICPRRCRVDRICGEKGVCRTGALPVVSAAQAHFGEEPSLTGYGGSGTIFFANCNLKCVFCQNWDISHSGEGEEITTDELSSIMVRLQRQGCHNINFVSPTHQIPQIIESLPKAIENGLDIPLVFNSGGYDSVEVIKLLEGVFDIYMPDFKYGDNETALALSAAPDYVTSAKAAIREMHRQVGDLVINKNGIAERGLIIRHLVLPDDMANTRAVTRFIAKELSPDTYVNIMDQYRPCFKAYDHPKINRMITKEEFDTAVRVAKAEGLKRIAFD